MSVNAVGVVDADATSEFLCVPSWKNNNNNNNINITPHPISVGMLQHTGGLHYEMMFLA